MKRAAARTAGKTDLIVCLMLVMFAAVYTGARLTTGWVPNDEGTLATSALRVMQGQLPQRDFSEIYTGGLSFWHAAAFRLWGVNLFSLRLAAMAAFLLWVPAVYYIARRMLGVLGAAVVTLTALAWSYPNYVASMPSWYNLYCATWAAAALMRYVDTRRRRWLVAAGVACGLSVLVKIIGLYAVAGVLLFLLYLEQERDETKGGASRCTAYRVLTGGLLLVFLGMVLKVVWGQMHPGEMYQFVLPAAGCVGVLLGRERRVVAATSGERWGVMLRLAGPFLVGVAAPLAVFLVPYLGAHAVGALVHGVFGSVNARMTGLAGAETAPGLGYMVYGLMTLIILLLGLFSPKARSHRATAVVGLCLALTLGVSALAGGLQDTWLMGGMLTPLVVLLGVVLLSRPVEREAGTRLMLMVSLTSVCTLVQFPLAYVTYFCYVAPLVLLTGVAVVKAVPAPPGRGVLAALLLFFCGFGYLALLPMHIYNPEIDVRAARPLGLERAGRLRVDRTTPEYGELIPFLQAHSPNGLMFAGNDCPELYFLSGLTDPTRDDTGTTPEVLGELASGRLQLVVLKDQPFLPSEAVKPELRAAVVAALPEHRAFGRFSVYWR